MHVSEFTRDDGNSYVKKLLTNGKRQGTDLDPKTVKDIASVLKFVLQKYILFLKTMLTFFPKAGMSLIT